MPSRCSLPLFSPRPVVLFLVAALLAAAPGCGGGDSVELTEEQNYFVLAAAALASGDDAQAMEMLSKSIASKPSRYAHYERARIHERQGADDQALADCAAALQLQPGDKDALWLQGEIKKPKDKRFKGRFATPPSAAK
jgi:Tfp pilus assembly protein PilF